MSEIIVTNNFNLDLPNKKHSNNANKIILFLDNLKKIFLVESSTLYYNFIRIWYSIFGVVSTFD